MHRYRARDPRHQETTDAPRRSRLALLALGLALGLLGLVPSGWADPGIEPLSRIHAVAQAFLEQDAALDGALVRVRVGQIDSRLRLPRCAAEPVAYFPYAGAGRAHTTVGVRCVSPAPWKLFVNARVEVFREVVVARHGLRRGTLLGLEDLAIASRDVNALRNGFVEDPARLVGKRLKRDLAAGRTLDERLVAAPKSVRRGQQVVLLAGSGGLEVRVAGKALADGGLGDQVRVRNQRSKQVVEGIVAGRGLVRVRM